MRTYTEQNFAALSTILMPVAQGIAVVSGYKYLNSDMVFSLAELNRFISSGRIDKEPFFIALREAGVECGTKEECIDRCKGLGYPLVIAKVYKGHVFDWDINLMFTHNWMNGDNNYMEQEFNSL